MDSRDIVATTASAWQCEPVGRASGTAQTGAYVSILQDDGSSHQEASAAASPEFHTVFHCCATRPKSCSTDAGLPHRRSGTRSFVSFLRVGSLGGQQGTLAQPSRLSARQGSRPFAALPHVEPHRRVGGDSTGHLSMASATGTPRRTGPQPPPTRGLCSPARPTDARLPSWGRCRCRRAATKFPLERKRRGLPLKQSRDPGQGGRSRPCVVRQTLQPTMRGSVAVGHIGFATRL